MFKSYIRHSGSLFVLNIPPPYGGGEIVHWFLFERIKETYDVITVSRDVHDKNTQGKFRIRNIFVALWVVLYQGYWILRLRPRTFFIGIPKDFFPFVRMSLLVHLAKLTGAMVVGDLHGMAFNFLNGSRQRYYLFTINKFDRIRVLGESIKKAIAATGFRHELRVVDNGIDEPRDTSGSIAFNPGDRMHLLYLSAISESKGFGKAIEVFKEASRLFPGRLTIDIAGEFVDEQSRAVFENLLSDVNLSGFVKYHDRVLGEKKWDLMASSTLLLHFSRYDGQPITIIEAMALGIPTVATKIGAIPEMISQGVNGFLVDDYLADSIKAISGILTGSISYSQLSQNARKTFESRFTVDRYVANICNLAVD